MFMRLFAAIAAAVVVAALVAPLPAAARMHFTTTRERLQALAQRADSALALTDPAAIQTQVREMVNQAQAAKAAAEEAAQRPVSSADDKSVLANVTQDMDGIVASANRALSASGADQRTALQDVKTRADRSLRAVDDRIRIQLSTPAPPASPSTLPAAGQSTVMSGGTFVLTIVGFLAVLVGFGLVARVWLGRGAAR